MTLLIACLIAALAAILATGAAFALLGDRDAFLPPAERDDFGAATGQQVIDAMKLLVATPARQDLTQPEDEDPYEDWTNHDPAAVTVHIAPSPCIGERTQQHPAPAAPARPLHKHGRPKWDTTLLFEGIAAHEGHPVIEHGDDELPTRFVTPPVRGRQTGWVEAITP